MRRDLFEGPVEAACILARPLLRDAEGGWGLCPSGRALDAVSCSPGGDAASLRAVSCALAPAADERILHGPAAVRALRQPAPVWTELAGGRASSVLLTRRRQGLRAPPQPRAVGRGPALVAGWAGAGRESKEVPGKQVAEHWARVRACALAHACAFRALRLVLGLCVCAVRGVTPTALRLT